MKDWEKIGTCETEDLGRCHIIWAREAADPIEAAVEGERWTVCLDARDKSSDGTIHQRYQNMFPGNDLDALRAYAARKHNLTCDRPLRPARLQ